MLRIFRYIRQAYYSLTYPIKKRYYILKYRAEEDMFPIPGYTYRKPDLNSNNKKDKKENGNKSEVVATKI